MRFFTPFRMTKKETIEFMDRHYLETLPKFRYISFLPKAGMMFSDM
jgi:hypothetical protein